jgi:hypothetical protein
MAASILERKPASPEEAKGLESRQRFAVCLRQADEYVIDPNGEEVGAQIRNRLIAVREDPDAFANRARTRNFLLKQVDQLTIFYGALNF